MLPATKLRQFDLLAQLRASCAIARPAHIGMLGNLCGISETPCWLLPFNLFYEAEMVTVLAQLAARASRVTARASRVTARASRVTARASRSTVRAAHIKTL